MRRLLLLALLCALAPLGVYGQTAISGNLKDAGVANVTAQNTYVRFTLTNFGGNIPRITSTNVIAVPYRDFKPDANGNIAGTVEDNLTITPAGTFYQVCIFYQGVQFRCGTYLITGASFNLNSATPLSTIPTAGPNQVITQAFSCPQLTASTTWTCTHNFNDTNVQVQTFDSTGKLIYPDTVVDTSPNVVTITFVTAQAGLAVIFHAGSIAIATNQPNAVLQNPTGAQSISGTLNLTGTTAVTGRLDPIYLGAVRILCNQLGQSAGWAGNDLSVWYANAFADLPSGGGIIDARSCGPSETISQQMNLGEQTGTKAVALLLPSAAGWNVSITDGVSCAIKAWHRGVLEGPSNSGTSAMVIQPSSSSTNVKALYCTDTAFSGGMYARASGFQLYNNSGATVPKAMDVENVDDGSSFERIVVANYNNVGLFVQNACCSASFDHVTLNGNYGAGAQPLKFGSGNVGLSFFSLSAGHPGAGQNVIQLQGAGIRFYNLYMESSNTDTTTPLVAGVVASAAFYGTTMQYNNSVSSSAYVFDVAATDTQFIVSDLGMRGANQTSPAPAINDHINGLTYQSDSSGYLGYFQAGLRGDSVPLTTTRLQFPEQTNTGTPAPGKDVCYSDSVAHAVECSFNNGPFGQMVLDNAPQTLSSKTLVSPVINGASSGTGVQGTDSKLMTAGTISGTAANLCTDANGGATTSGCTFPAIQVAVNSSVCTTSSVAGSSCTTTVSWPSNFADTSYRASCSGVGPTQFPFYTGITSKAVGSVTVQITNGTASEAQASTFSSIECIGIHP
jgi:hypothetical protein